MRMMCSGFWTHSLSPLLGGMSLAYENGLWYRMIVHIKKKQTIGSISLHKVAFSNTYATTVSVWLSGKLESSPRRCRNEYSLLSNESANGKSIAKTLLPASCWNWCFAVTKSDGLHWQIAKCSDTDYLELLVCQSFWRKTSKAQGEHCRLSTERDIFYQCTTTTNNLLRKKGLRFK